MPQTALGTSHPTQVLPLDTVISELAVCWLAGADVAGDVQGRRTFMTIWCLQVRAAMRIQLPIQRAALRIHRVRLCLQKLPPPVPRYTPWQLAVRWVCLTCDQHSAIYRSRGLRTSRVSRGDPRTYPVARKAGDKKRRSLQQRRRRGTVAASAQRRMPGGLARTGVVHPRHRVE